MGTTWELGLGRALVGILMGILWSSSILKEEWFARAPARIRLPARIHISPRGLFLRQEAQALPYALYGQLLWMLRAAACSSFSMLVSRQRWLRTKIPC